MTSPARRSVMSVVVAASLGAAAASAQPLTADRAVEIALRNSPQLIQAEAGVLDARSGLYGAYSGILPHVGASVTRFNSVTEGSRSPFGTVLIEQDSEAHGTTPAVSGRWSVLDLSGIQSWRAASSGLKAARLSRTAARNDVVFGVRQQFYGAVQTYHLARVASGSLRVARDNERRVRALFEVGSVSRSDLLQAQVRTAQAELDSLSAVSNIVDARILLATALGIGEGELGAIDTVLEATPRDIDEALLQREAAEQRPDLLAARAAYNSARSNRTAARLGRLPTLEAQSTIEFDTRSRRTSTTNPPGLPPIIEPGIEATESETDRAWSGSLSLNLNLFDGFGIESRNAAAEARLRRARAELETLERNLAASVNQAVIQYREAVERERVARRAYEAAVENLKLTQQKYNVGSATILELVDAQVQATRAEADMVSARAAIRIAEARLEQVRGRGE